MARKKKGRKKFGWLPFIEARSIIHDECIGSISQYHKWWDANKPKIIPKYPFRVYIAEWVSWNDFLNNDNVFKQYKQGWRTYEECIPYVHALNCRTQKEWFAWIKAGNKPDCIPSRPDLKYARWISWMQWLGSTAVAKVEAQQKATEIAGIFYCIHINDSPNNIFRFGVAVGGKGQLQDMHKKHPFRVIRLFKYEADFDWKHVISNGATTWSDSIIGGEYICSNINQLLFDIDLDWVK